MLWRGTKSKPATSNFATSCKTSKPSISGADRHYEVTAISIHAYAYLADKYALLNHGASMGENYGP
jgi:predicted solute-binding protein